MTPAHSKLWCLSKFGEDQIKDQSARTSNCFCLVSLDVLHYCAPPFFFFPFFVTEQIFFPCGLTMCQMEHKSRLPRLLWDILETITHYPGQLCAHCSPRRLAVCNRATQWSAAGGEVKEGCLTKAIRDFYCYRIMPAVFVTRWSYCKLNLKLLQ